MSDALAEIDAKLSEAKAEAPSARRSIEVLYARDMREPRLDGNPLVKGIFEAETVNLIFGPPGCGKTFLTLDLALAIARGIDWFGHRTKQGKVVYLATEAGRSIHNRVAAYLRHHDVEDDPAMAVIVSPVDLCHLRKKDSDAEDDVDRLVHLFRKVRGQVNVLIVDTVSRALAGGNENGPDDMGAFIMALDRLRHGIGCAVIAVHHVGKDASRGARGHSLLHAAVDTEIEVERRDDELMVSVARITKHRDGPAGTEIGFRLEQVELGLDQDGDPVTTCVIEPSEYVPAKKEKSLSPQLQATLDALNRAIEERGQTVPNGVDGGWGYKGVPVEIWREHMLNMPEFAGMSKPAFNNAWARRQKLIELGKVKAERGIAWPTDQAPF